MQGLGEIEKDHSIQSQRIAHPPLLEGNLAVGFFYGASENGGVSCGAGLVLKCLVLSVFSIKMNCGHETNTRGSFWSYGVFCTLSITNGFHVYLQS
jgi:hypothetical protein